MIYDPLPLALLPSPRSPHLPPQASLPSPPSPRLAPLVSLPSPRSPCLAPITLLPSSHSPLPSHRSPSHRSPSHFSPSPRLPYPCSPKSIYPSPFDPLLTSSITQAARQCWLSLDQGWMKARGNLGRRLYFTLVQGKICTFLPRFKCSN